MSLSSNTYIHCDDDKLSPPACHSPSATDIFISFSHRFCTEWKEHSGGAGMPLLTPPTSHACPVKKLIWEGYRGPVQLHVTHTHSEAM